MPTQSVIKKCFIPDCEKPARTRGWCSKHYSRWHRHGDPLGGRDRSRPLLERLLARVDKNGPGGCWLWTGGTSKGYGSVGSGLLAHRVAYEAWAGPIPAGFEIDHLCMVPRCVNPEHLEPVTHLENVHRADVALGRGSAKTHCHHGHEYTEANTYKDPKSGRRCRACRRISRNELRARLGRRVAG